MKTDSTTPLFLGIEGGATRMVSLLVDSSGNLVRRRESGPANWRLFTELEVLRRFREIAREIPCPAAIGIGLAGARDEKDWKRIAGLADRIWPGIPCRVTHDLETAITAAGWQENERSITRVIVVSGTGSCCYGRTPDGRTAKLGGWGHLLGDKGSGYEIGLRALKAVVYYLDRDGTWPLLGRQILQCLQLNKPDDLVAWIQSARKDEVAALAVEVFAAAARRDEVARDILKGAASTLAKDAASCARKLVKAGVAVEFIFTGSVLARQPAFRRRVAEEIKEVWPQSRCLPLTIESAWGAVILAKRKFEEKPLHSPVRWEGIPRRPRAHSRLPPARMSPALAPLPPTEERNPRSMRLDRLSLADGIRLMLDEEAAVAKALLAEEKQIERALQLIVRALRHDGRLLYIGAGTSGRLGVLDASECPPTFRTPPRLVQGIIAGGQNALWQSVEGAEDDAGAGTDAMKFRRVNGRDVVVGIAASGHTPFVRGALVEARKRGARTILLCFNPHLKTGRGTGIDVLIAPDVGPEILTGSTRLKCGTATKLVLNMFTTLAMVRLGKVVSNLMVDVNPSNAKLRDRAVRIVEELSGCDTSVAQDALEQSGWVVKKAWRKLVGRAHRKVTKA